VFGRAGRAAGAAAAAPGFCATGPAGRCPVGRCAAGAVGVRAGVAGGGGGGVGARVAGGGGGGGGVVGAGVGVGGGAPGRFNCTALPSTLGRVPVCVAGIPPTAKFTVAPTAVQPLIACTSTMYDPPPTVPNPHATPPIVAVTVAPVVTGAPAADVTDP
jgi:hypothetical protein